MHTLTLTINKCSKRDYRQESIYSVSEDQQPKLDPDIQKPTNVKLPMHCVHQATRKQLGHKPRDVNAKIADSRWINHIEVQKIPMPHFIRCETRITS